ncbi:MAG: M14 family zinc carboxypeptidase [bacterium]
MPKHIDLRKTILLTAGLFLLPAAAAAQDLPRTGAERAGWERSTSHEELMDFLFEVQVRSSNILIQELTTTRLGRVVPLVILGDPPSAEPATLLLSGKPTLFITCSIHGGEYSGKEGGQQFIRELALGGLRPVLEEVNVLIIPSLNPDGAEAEPRSTRTNSMGYDMNRDFIVMETEEVSAAVEEVLLRWWPDVYVDAHNGGAYPYHLTYQATLHPSADQPLVDFANGPMYEYVKQHLAEQDLLFYWYSGPRQDRETGEWYWRTTTPWVRKQHSYGGMQNVITLLYEVPGRHDLDVQADAQREGFEGLLRFMAENAGEVRRTVVDARRRTLHQPRDEVVLGFEERSHPGKDRFYVIPERGAEPELVTGERRTLYVPSATRPRPWAYAFDANLHHVADQLRRHHIEVEKLVEPVTLTVERYRLLDLEYADGPYQNHILAEGRVTTVEEEITLPAGSYVVRTVQNSGRVASYMLEPDTDDSLFSWNYFDAVMPRPDPEGESPRSALPLYRIPVRVPMKAVTIR